MAKIISFANQKGGVGKSTLCIQTAFFLSEDKTKRVLVIDMDPQGNTSSRLAARTETEDGGIIYHYTGTRSAELFQKKSLKITVTKCPSGADLIYTPRNDPDLAEIEQEPLDVAENPAKHLAKIADDYDYVLIDCPPSLGRKLVGALVASTHVVCPVKLSGFSVDGVEDILNTIIGLQQSANKNLNLVGIVINDMDRSVSHEKALSQLNATVPDLLFKNIIMHRPPLDSATSDGVPVWSLRYGHVAAAEVKAVLNEIMNKVG
ncbi:ParA family protein [Eoetvoesiella caeni]